jgi:tetratricopeptide (TPR) repeat protein
MIRLLSIFALLSASALAAPDESFLRGNDAYTAGDYATAKRLYTESLQRSPDENAWYNLGNACFRLDQPGEAALAYERVLALSPGHAEAVSNLRFVRQKTGARVKEPTWLQQTLAVVPPAAATWLAIGVTWLGFAWAGSALWRRTGRGGIIGGSALVLLGGAYATGLHWWQTEQGRAAIVIAGGAEAKAEPAKDAQTAETLPSGSRVRWISGIAGWDFCEMPSGQRAWLPSKNLERIVTPRS